MRQRDCPGRVDEVEHAWKVTLLRRSRYRDRRADSGEKQNETDPTHARQGATNSGLRILVSSKALELGAMCPQYGLCAAAGGVPPEHAAAAVLAAREEPLCQVGAEIRPE